MARGVPQCNFYDLVVYLNYFGQKLNSDSGLLALVELVANVARRNAGLARPAVPDHYDFEHLVVLVHSLVMRTLVGLIYIISKQRLYIYLLRSDG